MQTVIKDTAWAIFLVTLFSEYFDTKIREEITFFLTVQQAQTEQLNKGAVNCYHQLQFKNI